MVEPEWELSDADYASLRDAAPELYDALAALLREVVEAGFETAKDFGWPTVIPKARAALAKARGETP